MKKIILITFGILVVLIGIYFILGYTKKTVYTNEYFGFSLEIPASWEKKCQIVEDEYSVTFYQRKTLKKYGDASGRLFSIDRIEKILSKEEAEKTRVSPAHFLANSKEHTYIMDMPSDVQAPSWNGGNLWLEFEYDHMAEQIDSIKESFKLLDYT